MKDAKSNSTHEKTIAEVISSLGETMQADAAVLIDLMSSISGQPPKVWNIGTIGFGTYHYVYESGREGDVHTIGFYPRDGKITFYLMDGTDRYSDLLAKLGKHSISKACLYVKRLSDIDLGVLKSILDESYKNLSAQNGQIYRETR